LLLKELTELTGVSGNEYEVREYIKREAGKYDVDIKTDSMGNLIVFKKGKNPRYKVMLSAHMDEVGFIVTGYGEFGTIKFSTVGGIDSRILLGKKVLVGEKKIPGVIGCKPVHLQSKDERDSNLKISSMYIDIGVDKKEEAEKLAPLGEYIAFYSEYTEFGEDCIKAKALDDRVGCAVLLDALKYDYNFDLYACFTTQEEVGLRGAKVAAYTVDPDVALVLEGTTCSDVPGAEKYEYSTILGKGAALTLADATTYVDRNFVNYIYNLAVENNIEVQFKQTISGGNDAGSIHKSRSGVKVASISVPCRYIHSPVSVMSRKDFESVKSITNLVLAKFSQNQDVIKAIKEGRPVL